jgi:hypothetical protein
VTSVLHRRTTGQARAASRVEEAAARAWNVLNEGKPFTVVFGAGLLLAMGAPPLGLVACVPLAVAWWRHPWPLHLRIGLWAVAAAVVAVAGGLPAGAALAGLAAYLVFTVVLWGTVYYHLRLGASLGNWRRFWWLVLENPDPTSGNFLEQAPKVAALLAVGHAATTAASLPRLWLAGVGAWGVGAVVHRRLVTWVPGWATGERASDRRPVDAGPARCGPPSRRTLLVVIDGCRADRLAEARTPFLDRLAAEGISYARCSTVYPARTVTGFSSMLTGAPPVVHGMRSNFVPRPRRRSWASRGSASSKARRRSSAWSKARRRSSASSKARRRSSASSKRGVRCASIFDVVPSSRLVGIAHLVDAFGGRVSTVTSVMPNDEIDAALCRKALEVVDAEDPELLVVQTLSVDQTGHFRGSYHDEYLAHVESTDGELERLVDALAQRWGGLDGVTIGVLSDHGQGRGIGGHGHWTPTERWVPCIWWGHGVPSAVVRDEVTIMDVAPTLAHRLGVSAPSRSVGRCLLCDGDGDGERDDDDVDGPVVVVLPVHDEAATVADVIGRVPATVCGRAVVVVVVDDGSTDGSGDLAVAAGAKVVAHDRNRGLGAAVRTGFAEARRLDAAAVAFLDADGEYDPAALEGLVAPVLDGDADYVVGNRFGGGDAARPVDMRWHRRAGNVVLTALASLVVRRRLADAQSGFRVLGAHALRHAEVGHDYNYAQVLTISLLRKGFRYAEVPIGYARRRHGRSFVKLGRYLANVLPAMARAARTR